MADDPEETRALAYEVLTRSPPGSAAAKFAREALAQLPKRQVGRDMNKELQIGSKLGEHESHGEFSGGDLGSELPPTSDEMAGLPNNPEKPGFLTRGATHALYAPTRREYLRGVDDMVTFGAGQRLARGAEKLTGGESFSEEGQRSDAQESPDARGYGQLTGSFLPGAATKTFKAGTGLTSGIARQGKGMIGKSVSGAAAGAGANLFAMPVIAGAQAAVRGENPLPAAREQFNPLNAGAGAAIGLLGGASRGIRETGQTGRDIRLAEQYGATPTPFGGAKKGAYDSPLLRDIEGSARDQGNLARRGGDYVYRGMQEEHGAASRRYAAETAEAEAAGQLEGMIPHEHMRAEATRLLRSEGLTGPEKGAIRNEVINVLNRHPEGMSVADFNAFRQKLGRIFGVGVSEAEVPAIDNLRRAAKHTIDETEMGPINERYHQAEEGLRRQRMQLGIGENQRQELAEKQIANLIVRRAGERNVTPGIQEGGDHGVSSFLQENPRYQLSFDLPELVAAKERMSLGLEPQAGFFRRLGRHALMEKNLEPAAVGLYRGGRAVGNQGVPASVAAQLLMGGPGPGFTEMFEDENALP